MAADPQEIFLPREGSVPLKTLAQHMEKLALSAQVLAAARQKVDTHPTEAQQEAGNYAKGHVAWKGFEIAIENPKGSTRSGQSKDGKTWSVVMKAEYGYIKGSCGADKDHVDCFLGPDLASELIFVVNQVDPATGRFDEHKVMLGWTNKASAARGYLENYTPGWRGLGSIKPMTLPEFKEWLDGDTTKRAAWDGIHGRVRDLAGDEDSLLLQVRHELSQIRRQGHQGLPTLEKILSCLLQRHGAASLGDIAGTDQESGRLQAKQLSLGDPDRAGSKSEHVKIAAFSRKDTDADGMGCGNGAQARDCNDAAQQRVDSQAGLGDIARSRKEETAATTDISRKDAGDSRVGSGAESYVSYHPCETSSRLDGGAGIDTDQLSQPEKIGSVKIPVLGRDPMEALKLDPHFNSELTRTGSLLGAPDPTKPKKKRKRRKKRADDAQGLPSRKNYGDLSQLESGRLLDFVIQLHEAQRAGKHYDVRFGDPEHGLFSWATRKELPEPGRRTALFQQPLHRHDYMNFQGTLKGYGAGQVRTARKGQVLLTAVTPTKVEFTTADERHPQRYTLLKPPSFKDKDWLLVNSTPDQPVPYNKVHMLKIPREQVEEKLKALSQGDSVQAKVDGASSLVRLLKDGVEVLSYRASKVTGRPIIHTERVFHGRPKLSIPQELVGSILKGEIYGIRDDVPGDPGGDSVRREPLAQGGGQGEPAASGRLPPGNRRAAQAPAGDNEEVNHGSGADQAGTTVAQGEAPAAAALSPASPGADALPGPDGGRGDGGLGTRLHGTGMQGGAGVLGPQELGGLLNSTLGESLRQQRDQKVKLRIMLHNIQQLGNHPLDPHEVPYQERMDLLREAFLPHLPADTFHLAESAQTPEQATALWQQIQSGQHPLTREGVVIHPSLGVPSKGKLTEEQDVHITGTFPGEGKYRGRGVGGFTYALTPAGPSVGRIGTGLVDALRISAHQYPEDYVGRVARVRSQGPFESGALRAPSLIALHEDYPSFDKAAIDLESLQDLGIAKDAAAEGHVPTVAVDLDGTIATEGGGYDPEKIGRPRKGARKWLRRFHRAGARIIVYTVRGDVDLIADYMQRYRLPYDHINYNPDQPQGSSGKVVADVYWDNRAIDASGPLAQSAPTVLERLKVAADDTFLLHYREPEDVLRMIHLLKESCDEPALHP